MPMPSVRLDWAARPFGIFRDPNLGDRGRWILYAALIGVVSGVGAILFDLAFRLSQWGLLGQIGRFQPPGPGGEGGPGFGPESLWLLPVSLVVGGLLSGALVFGLAPEAEGHGTDAVIRSFHHLRGRIRRRVPVVKAISSAITIGSGGSAGREGPIAQIGAGFGSWLADLLRLRDRDRRVMMMAGVAGGIGSIFRAPLGAALFSAEVLYSQPEFEYTVLLPGLISAITGYSIYASYAGFDFLFDVPELSFRDPRQLAVYLVLGIGCAVAGAIYPKIFYGARDRLFRPLPIPAWTKPAAGALMLGGIAAFFPEVLGMGYGYVQQAIDGSHTAGFLLTFAVLKIIATSLTISSGGSGGVFAPSLVMGGALGGAFGLLARSVVPEMAPDPAACVMVGMGGFFAGVAKVPFASVIMVMEMTGSYGLLVPSLLVATIAYLAIPAAARLYEHQVASRADSPAHLGSFAVDVLRHGRVGECWRPQPDGARTIPEDTPLTELVSMTGQGRVLFPVAHRDGTVAGEISLEDVRRAILADVPRELLVAHDLMKPVTGPLTPEDDLATAARLLAGRDTDALLVLADRQRGPVLGTFNRRDLIVGYGTQLERLRGGTGAVADSGEDEE